MATDGQEADLTSDSTNLAVVLEDVGGGDQVEHTVDDQLAVAGQLVALPLKESDLRLLLLLTLTWVARAERDRRLNGQCVCNPTESRQGLT